MSDGANGNPGADAAPAGLASFTRRVLIFLLLTAAAFFIWQVRDALLLLFGGIVLATILCRLTDFVRRVTHLGRLWALWIVLLLLGGVLAGVILFMYPRMTEEASRIAAAMPEIRARLEESQLGAAILDRIKPEQAGMRWGSLFSQVTGVASGVFNFFTSLFLMLFLTLFISVNPGWYVRGIVGSFPKHRRERMREVMHCAGEALWRWLIAQAFAMLIIGILSTLGMLVVGMRFAVVLGLLAGMFQFVPFVGAVLWALPATLLALAESPTMALKVLAVYVVIQTLEGNVITPMVQKHEAYLPPVIILLATVMFGILFGPMGLILATPLTVVSLVFYQMLYRQDTLGDSVSSLGDEE